VEAPKAPAAGPGRSIPPVVRAMMKVHPVVREDRYHISPSPNLIYFEILNIPFSHLHDT